jgi:hypothetical protein
VFSVVRNATWRTILLERQSLEWNLCKLWYSAHGKLIPGKIARHGFNHWGNTEERKAWKSAKVQLRLPEHPQSLPSEILLETKL